MENIQFILMVVLGMMKHAIELKHHLHSFTIRKEFNGTSKPVFEKQNRKF